MISKILSIQLFQFLVLKINKFICNCKNSNAKDELLVVLSEMKILSDPFVSMKTEYMRFKTLHDLGVLF
jgi:hypothetical protein